MIKVAFLGTPSIGASALQSLINDSEIEVVVAVTNEDKAIGRSHSKLQATPVAKLSINNNIDVIKTNSINKDIDKLKEYEFEYMVTCAFGQFLSDDVLALPTKKALNVHGSLLPEGRGGAPLHWAIINGKDKTGISIMEMVSKMDAGDYYSQFELPIAEDDNVDDLFINMSNLILEKTAIGVKEVDSGKESTKQDEEKVTFWMNIKKEDSKINFNKPVEQVYNQIRGLTSKPGAWALFNGKRIKVNLSNIEQKDPSEGKYGAILGVSDNGIAVNTAKGVINLVEITIEGEKRKKITKNDHDMFINGHFE